MRAEAYTIQSTAHFQRGRFLKAIDSAYFATLEKSDREKIRKLTPKSAEMISAEGRIWENPATGYLHRDPGMPLDAMNPTPQILIGTWIGCAQCHNHPFDKWTQKDFYHRSAIRGCTRRRADHRFAYVMKLKPLVSVAESRRDETVIWIFE